MHCKRFITVMIICFILTSPTAALQHFLFNSSFLVVVEIYVDVFSFLFCFLLCLFFLKFLIVHFWCLIQGVWDIKFDMKAR